MPKVRKKSLHDVLLQIRLTKDEKRAFLEAADRRHLTLSAWVRLAGLQAAKAEGAPS
jgi:uncharacterized protein (DUF1778 family)